MWRVNAGLFECGRVGGCVCARVPAHLWVCVWGCVWCVGGPGSGKALQSERLEERLGLRRVSPGDVLCSELQSHSERGRRLRDALERGETLPEVRHLPSLHCATHTKPRLGLSSQMTIVESNEVTLNALGFPTL